MSLNDAWSDCHGLVGLVFSVPVSHWLIVPDSSAAAAVVSASPGNEGAALEAGEKAVQCHCIAKWRRCEWTPCQKILDDGIHFADTADEGWGRGGPGRSRFPSRVGSGRAEGCVSRWHQSVARRLCVATLTVCFEPVM